MHFLLCRVVFVLAVVSFGNAQRDCVDTGTTCREGCLPGSNGEFQWCGSCEYYIVCTNGAPTLQPCPDGLVWDNDAKRCVVESLTCEQCVVPFAKCAETGSSCIVDCLTYPDGTYQWCGRCDYFLICSIGTTSYFKCQQDTLEYDDSFKACISTSTTCFDDPCHGGLPSGDCSSNPCYSGGTCQEQGNGYICICPPHYTGQQCLSYISLCPSQPCLNGATCYPTLGGDICVCLPEWTGDRCETPLIPCNSGACLNGGQCMNNGDGTMSCVCPEDWTGTFCESPLFLCDSNHCLNGGTCIKNNVDTPTTFCVCPDDWTGTICESPNYIISCGDLTWTEYPAKNGFTIFCYYWVPLSDVVGRSTECAYVFHELPIWGNSSTLIREGGAFGCINSQNYPNDNAATSQIACDEYYQHSVTLGEYDEDAKMMICIRYPYPGMMPEI